MSTCKNAQRTARLVRAVAEEPLLHFQFYIPTRIIFGPGTLNTLEDTPHLPTGEQAMIVIGESGAMLTAGYLQRVQGLLANRGVRTLLCDRVRSNPESAMVEEAAATARAKKVDFIVGLGGGSTIDAAKSIALMAANKGRYGEIIRGGNGCGEALHAKALPVVALPTTAGSGSEVTPWMAITRSGCAEKITWGNDNTGPYLSIVDPELTHTLPPRFTACSGMVAFFHAVGAILGTPQQPAVDMLALEAIQIISRFLARTVTDGTDTNARTMLSWAGTAAGMCTALTPASWHQTLAQALSATAPGLPHGAALALLAPIYFDQLKSRLPARFDLLSDAMGVAPDAAPESGQQRFLTGLRHLIRSVGLGNESLADYGLGSVDIPPLVRKAFNAMKVLPGETPDPMDLPEIEALLAAAMQNHSAVAATTDTDGGSSAQPTLQRRHPHGT